MKASQIAAVMGGKTQLHHLLGELRELAEEVVKLNLPGMKDEGSDVCWMFWTFIYFNTGLDFYAIGTNSSWAKYQKRLGVWEDIFKKHNLKFHPKYLANGGNFKRPEKVEAAISLARREQL